MKKILYILFAVSLLAVGCTKEVEVSRDHNLDAEVTDMATTMEMKTLYCNLNEAEYLDLQLLKEYLTAQNADVTMFVAPAVVGEDNVDFRTWLDTYAQECNSEDLPEEQRCEYSVLEARNDDGRLTMVALIKAHVPHEHFPMPQGSSLHNAFLYFKANGINFVVTELLPAKNTIPVDWELQVNDMLTQKKALPLVYDPDDLAERKSEIQRIIDRTMENADNTRETHWFWAINMNTESPLDITKYEHLFPRMDYYNPAAHTQYKEKVWKEKIKLDEEKNEMYDEDGNPIFETDDEGNIIFVEVEEKKERAFVWEEFLTKSNKYYSVTENLETTDDYFGVHSLMLSTGLVDCNAVHHSIYTPTTVRNEELFRHNFLYATSRCWSMFQSFDMDTASAVDLGVAHYPIIVTLKSEE